MGLCKTTLDNFYTSTILKCPDKKPALKCPDKNLQMDSDELHFYLDSKKFGLAFLMFIIVEINI